MRDHPPTLKTALLLENKQEVVREKPCMWVDRVLMEGLRDLDLQRSDCSFKHTETRLQYKNVKHHLNMICAIKKLRLKIRLSIKYSINLNSLQL